MSKFLELLCPTEYVDSVHRIDISRLKQQGITAILTDMDNTLVPWRGLDIAADVMDWVKSATEQGIKFCIVSNTRTPKRLKKLADTLGIPFAKRGAKPRRVGFREALKMLDVAPSQAAVVGDQVFTDVLGGNRLGLYTILVRPIHHKEFAGTKISRFFEKIVLRQLEQKGMIRRPGAESGSSHADRCPSSRR